MNHGEYQQQLGATAACTKKMMEATKGVGQRYRKGATKDCFRFDSWFSSKKFTEAVMEVVDELVFIVNKNTKLFCQNNIEKLTKDCP